MTFLLLKICAKIKQELKGKDQGFVEIKFSVEKLYIHGAIHSTFKAERIRDSLFIYQGEFLFGLHISHTCIFSMIFTLFRMRFMQKFDKIDV